MGELGGTGMEVLVMLVAGRVVEVRERVKTGMELGGAVGMEVVMLVAVRKIG